MGTGSKHVRIRSPTPGTPPPLDTIVREASAFRREVPNFGESDDECRVSETSGGGSEVARGNGTLDSSGVGNPRAAERKQYEKWYKPK